AHRHLIVDYGRAFTRIVWLSDVGRATDHWRRIVLDELRDVGAGTLAGRGNRDQRAACDRSVLSHHELYDAAGMSRAGERVAQYQNGQDDHAFVLGVISPCNGIDVIHAIRVNIIATARLGVGSEHNDLETFRAKCTYRTCAARRASIDD